MERQVGGLDLLHIPRSHRVEELLVTRPQLLQLLLRPPVDGQINGLQLNRPAQFRHLLHIVVGKHGLAQFGEAVRQGVRFHIGATAHPDVHQAQGLHLLQRRMHRHLAHTELRGQGRFRGNLFPHRPGPIQDHRLHGVEHLVGNFFFFDVLDIHADTPKSMYQVIISLLPGAVNGTGPTKFRDKVCGFPALCYVNLTVILLLG